MPTYQLSEAEVMAITHFERGKREAIEASLLQDR